jgi:hypothetical protein
LHRTLVSAYIILLGGALAATATYARRAHTAERQLAAARAAGYRQGLAHAALGLLSGSTRMDATDERTPE